MVVERLAVGAVDGDGVGVVLVDGSVPEGGKQQGLELKNDCTFFNRMRSASFGS